MTSVAMNTGNRLSGSIVTLAGAALLCAISTPDYIRLENEKSLAHMVGK
jgi:hypothetical protein